VGCAYLIAHGMTRASQ